MIYVQPIFLYETKRSWFIIIVNTFDSLVKSDNVSAWNLQMVHRIFIFLKFHSFNKYYRNIIEEEKRKEIWY